METEKGFTLQIHRSLEQEQGSKKDRQTNEARHIESNGKCMGMNTSQHSCIY